MSLSISPNSLVAAGSPILFWIDRQTPFIIGQERVSHSGKVAMIKTTPDGLKGKPMTIAFRMAKKSHVDAWITMVNNDPFNTTSLASYFVTGRQVVFRPKDPIIIENEIIKEFDTDQTIFVSAHGDYKAGFDYFRGRLNLIIVS